MWTTPATLTAGVTAAVKVMDANAATAMIAARSVLSVSRWADSETAAREGLTGALDDGDADVRAYARQALSRAG